jgi:hypothetical protein
VKKLDIVGKTFGWLTIRDDNAEYRSHKRYVRCQCRCGTEKVILWDNIQNGRIVSCGCYGAERRRVSKTLHGKCKTTEYNSWASAKQRCYDTNHPKYPKYGGRGIKMCDRWFGSYSNFISDMGLKPSPELTIHRVNNDLGYEPSNCIWANDDIQSNNKTTSHWLECRGEKHTIAQWTKRAGLNQGTIHDRLKRGWDVESAIFTPIRKTR